MLHRARLPQPTIALAACILDALSPSFPRQWASTHPPHTPSHTRPLSLTPPSSPPLPSPRQQRPPRKDALIPLAALKLAHAFLHDSSSSSDGGSARWWAAHVAGGAFAAADVEAAVWVVLRDLGYSVHGFDPRAVEGMERVLFGGAAAAATPKEEREGRGWAVLSGGSGGAALPTPEVSPLRLGGRSEDWGREGGGG